jgi:hypothetical protein
LQYALPGKNPASIPETTGPMQVTGISIASTGPKTKYKPMQEIGFFSDNTEDLQNERSLSLVRFRVHPKRDFPHRKKFETPGAPSTLNRNKGIQAAAKKTSLGVL